MKDAFRARIMLSRSIPFTNLSAEWEYIILFVAGLFNPSHMEYEVDRSSGSSGEPSLAEMTSKAIQIIRKDNDGYFLLVEGKINFLTNSEVRTISQE